MKKRAFTLIEIMVVILILGVLSAIIVPRVVGRSAQAKKAKAIADIATLGSLLQQFHLDTKRFPTTEEGLDSLRTAPADLKSWQGPYLTTPLLVDPWGNEYVYEYPGSGGPNTYKLKSFGADGTEGGEGDNEDIVDALEKL